MEIADAVEVLSEEHHLGNTDWYLRGDGNVASVAGDAWRDPREAIWIAIGYLHLRVDRGQGAAPVDLPAAIKTLNTHHHLEGRDWTLSEGGDVVSVSVPAVRLATEAGWIAVGYVDEDNAIIDGDMGDVGLLSP